MFGNDDSNDDSNDMNFEDAWKKAANRKPIAPDAQDAKIIAQALDRVEIARRDVAAVYANAEGGSVIEVAAGNALVKLRVAAKEMRTALGEMMQMRMDMDMETHA